MVGCHFCDVKRTSERVFFSKEGEEYDCNRLLKDEPQKGWFAVLNGDQYTKGHTLVIARTHRKRVPKKCSFDIRNLRGDHEVWKSIGGGIGHMRRFLTDQLDPKPEAVHILILCEGNSHLHAHLIPRYKYKSMEKEFYQEHYLQRAERLGVSEMCFREKLDMDEIHGMWYAAYYEMNFDQTCFGVKETAVRVRELEKLAKSLREVA